MAAGEAVAERTISFIVELGDKNNRNFMSPISGERVLRGAWLKENMPGANPHENFARMPNLPGMHIAVNVAAKKIGILDPLNKSSHKNLLQRAIAVVKAMWGNPMRPEKDQIKADCTPNELKDACYWVRRLLDQRACKVVSGAVPEMADILKMSGTVTFERYDQKAGAKKEKQPSARYIVPGPDEAGEPLIEPEEEDEGEE